MDARGFTTAEQRADEKKLDDRLVVLPEARPPRRRQTMILVAIGLVLALIGGTAIGYGYERKQVRIARADTAAAQGDLKAARTSAATAAAGANTKITDLQGQVSSLTDELTLAQNAKDLATVDKTKAEQQLTQIQSKLASVQAALTSLTGPRLHHGWHIGFLKLVGASVSPDIVVVDLGRWFTGADARAAAIADGVIQQGQHLPNPRYLRNTTFDLRTVDVTSTTVVTLRHYKGANKPTDVTLADLEKIFDSARGADERVRHDPFWVDVTDGQIDKIREQRSP